MASCSLTGGLPEFETQLPELSAKFVFVVPVSIMLGFLSLPLHWDSFAFSFYHVSFHQVGLLLCLVSTLLGPSWDCSSQVKSTTRHQICQGSVWFPWFCLTAAKFWNSGPVLQLGYSSVLFSKQREVCPRGLKAASLKRDPTANVASVMAWSQILFISFYVRCQKKPALLIYLVWRNRRLSKIRK